MHKEKGYAKYGMTLHADGSLDCNGRHYSKDIVDAVENVTVRFFPTLTEGNIDVLIAFQIAIYDKIKT